MTRGVQPANYGPVIAAHEEDRTDGFLDSAIGENACSPLGKCPATKFRDARIECRLRFGAAVTEDWNRQMDSVNAFLR